MQAYEVVEQLAATDSRLDKEQIVTDAFMAGCREFFVGAKLAYDILVTFGVQKVPAIEDEDLRPDDPGTFSWDAFLDLADRLRRRALTGNAASEALRAAAAACHGPTWNGFYRRVLRKDLACGTTDSTINKVLKKLGRSEAEANDLIIPVFECQLAHDGEDGKHAKKLRGKKLLDIKLDGVRLLTVLDKEAGTITQHSRNGKLNENFADIRRLFEPVLQAVPYSVVLDGEITGRTFQDLMTQVNRRSHVDTSDAKLALFDYVPLTEFHAGLCPASQIDRHKLLMDLEITGLLRQVADGRIFVVPKLGVDLDTPEGQASFAEFNRSALEAGYEGIMIKDPEAPYECKRSAAWLKKKPFISVSLELIGMEQGKPDGKRRDVMGAMVLRGEDDGKLVETKCGTGFSDDQLAEFWRRRDALQGMIVEVEADALTLERGATTYSLRFPRFKGFRGGVPGEKL